MQLLNFKVTLNPSNEGGIRNNGTGILLVHSRRVGFELLDSPRKIKFKGRPIAIRPGRIMENKETELLEKTPYIDPSAEEQRQAVADKLLEIGNLRIDQVQIGVFYRPLLSTPKVPRKFSVEWSEGGDNFHAWAGLESDNSLLRVLAGHFPTFRVCILR